MSKYIYWGFAVLILLFAGFISFILHDNNNYKKSMKELDAFSVKLQSKEKNEEPVVEKRKHVLPPHRKVSGDSNVRQPLVKEHLVKPKLDVNGMDAIIPPSTQGLFTEIEENFQVEDSLF